MAKGPFENLAPEVPQRQARIEDLAQLWEALENRGGTGATEGLAGWSVRLSWPLPLTWPPEARWRMAQYAYGFVSDLPGMREAERISAPWARVVYGPRTSKAERIGSRLRRLGRQVYRTLEPADTRLYTEATGIQRALHEAMGRSWVGRQMPWYRLDPRIRHLYKLWTKHNQKLLERVRDDHEDFFAWVEAEPGH